MDKAYTSKEIAEIVLQAMKIHNDSWVETEKGSFQLGQESVETTYGGYTINQYEAVCQVMGVIPDKDDTSLAFVLYLAMHWRNDLESWASDVLGIPPPADTEESEA